MTGWFETTIGEQATLQRGIDITRKEMSPGSIPVYSSGGINGHHDQAQVSGPGVVMGRKGSLGTVFYVEEDFWPHDTTLWVKDFHGNLPRFVYYFFKAMAAQLLALDVGSANPTLNRNHVHPIRTLWPERPVQERIAHILGALDDKIELNRRMNQTLEAIARAIFKSWFVDFDPVHAKAAGREPVGMDPETAALFPDSFQDSPLGKIPEGWEVKALDEIADFVNGAACQKYAAEPGKPSLPVVKIRELGQGVTPQTDRARLDIPEKHRADDGDVLFSWSGTLLCRIWTGGPCFVNQHIFKVTSASSPRWFHLFWINRHLEAFRGVAEGKATTMGHIKRSHLSDALVVVPGSTLLASVSKVMAPIVEAATRRELESRELAACRDALLPQLLSGAILLGDEGEPA